MKNVLIVGASGYIGSRLALFLSKKKYNITSICYPEIPSDKKWINYMQDTIVADVRSTSFIKRIAKKKFDLVIYLVSLDHINSNKSPHIVNSVNVLPLWNFLHFFSKNRNLKKFIYFSTIHVYGNPISKKIKESYHSNPMSYYGLTHLMAEKIVNFFNVTSNINSINIRLSNSYGEPILSDINCWNLVLNQFCLDAYNDKKIVIKSDGKSYRDFIHYNDLMNAVYLIINNNFEKTDFNIFNISSSKSYSIIDLANKVKNVYQKKFNKKINIQVNNKVKSKNSNKYIIDNSRLKKLGFNLTMDLDSGISKLFNYLTKNE